MKALRTRLASLLVMVSAGSLALLQSASGLAGVSEANTNPETQDLYRRDHDAGHRKHYQHHGHRSHTDHHHKHHDKEGKGKQDGPHHKAKDKHHHHKHHKKPNVPTYKISLVCSSIVVDSIRCPIRPTDPSCSPSSHAMNNGAAIVYINMQEPCSKDPPPLCSAALAMAMTDEPKTTNLSDDSVVVAKAEGNHNLRKHNRHGHRHRHRGHHGHGKYHHTIQKHRHGYHKHRRHQHRHGHHKHRHNQHRHHHNHNHDKNKHPYRDLCVAIGDFCGNNLYGCDFVATTQYRCDAIGERPRPITEDSASCGEINACLCPASPIGLICGLDLPKKCNAKSNTIYHCPNGKGTEPEEFIECKPGTVCNKKEAPIGAACCGKNCECPGDKEVCSTAFPDSCGFDKNAIYKCTSSGKPTKAKDCSDDEACVILSDGAACTKNDCKCPTDGDVCGSVFPQGCKIPTGDIYSCVKGKDPVLTEDCSIGGCIATKRSSMAAAAAVFQGTATTDNCVKDPCKCQEKGDVCGSTFPDDCKFPKDILYSCAGKDKTPKEKMTCSKNGCVPTAGDDVCGSCLCPNGTPTCGSVFGPECKKDNSTLYTCSRVDALPLSPTKCAWGCDINDGPDKCNTECLCKNGDNVCGSVFPVRCGYKPDTLYKCSSALVDPSAPVDCDWGCDVKPGSDICNADCLCKDKDDVCGSVFPAKCGLKPSSLYKCSGALADPSSPVVCIKGCDVKIGSDKCNTDCLCKDGNDVCGSDFPAKCGFKKDSLYKCSGALADPSRPQTCTYGPCLVIKDKNDICTPDPCLCTEKKKFCSNSLPTSCGFSNNTVLECTGSGVKPQVVEKCKVADTCVDDPVKGAICKCMPAESGQIINPYSSKCIAVQKLAVGAAVVLMNCTNEMAFKDWHLSDGRIKTYDNQFCLGYTVAIWPADNPMVVQRCASNEKTTLGWSIVNRSSIMSGEGNLCVDIQGPIYDDGNPIIAYPCHGGENQQWILPSGWGC